MRNFSLVKNKNLKIIGEKSYLKLINENHISKDYIKWLNDPEVNMYSSRKGKNFYLLEE